MDAPNPVRVAWSILRARRVAPPREFGSATADHTALAPVLRALADGGTPALAGVQDLLDRYLLESRAVDPVTLNWPEQLAYWINLYNAGALSLAARAMALGAESVLRIPGGFAEPAFDVAGELLSLDAVEHGKIRRFGDPRIHGALVCGSVSCPTLRFEPYRGDQIASQLDDQMRRFLAEGGARLDGKTRTVFLSRVFLWYGGDFARPRRMPTWIPARPHTLVRALLPWLDQAEHWVSSRQTKVRYQTYDWGLRCAVG